MLTLITEANLFTRRGAFLPPSFPNIGAAYLCGAVRRRGHRLDVIPWWETYLRTLCVDDVDGTVAAVDRHGTSCSTFLGDAYRKGGERALRGYLGRAYEWATSSRVQDYLVPERVHALQRILRDLYQLQMALVAEPSELGVPAVDVFVGRCEDLGNRLVGVSVLAFDEPLVGSLVRRLAASGFEVIVGGALTSTTAPAALERLCFEDWGATWLLRGHADATLPDLVDALDGGGAIPEIPGLMGKVDGGFRQGAELPRPVSSDIADPDFSDFDLARYYFPWPMLPLQTSRGCYWKACAFCRREVHGASYEPLAVGTLLDTLRRYREHHGVRHVMLSDEALPPEQAVRLAEAMAQAPDEFGELRFCAAARTDSAFTPDVLETLARGGLELVFWGVESGNQSCLDRMRKGTQVDATGRILRSGRRAGISNLCFVMVGFPGETEQEAMDTVAFLRDHSDDIDYCRVNPFQLEPGTAVFRKPERYGVTLLDGEDGYSVDRGMSREQSTKLARRMAAGELGQLSSERFLSLPTLGFGEEPMLQYFLQRVVGLGAERGDAACPMATTSARRAGNRLGFVSGPTGSPGLESLDDAEAALLSDLDGTAPAAEIASRHGDAAAPMERLLQRLSAAGRLVWLTDPRGGAD